jgi:hypothetical protein
MSGELSACLFGVILTPGLIGAKAFRVQPADPGGSTQNSQKECRDGSL